MRYRNLNRLDTRNVSIYRTILVLLPAVLLAALILAGCASSSGTFTASPSSLSFGNVAIGSSSNQSLMLTNSGTAASTVTQIAASVGGFRIKGPSLPLTLAGGQSATFTTTFAPTAIGSISGTISITRSELTSTRVSIASVPTAPVVTTQMSTITMA